MKTKITSKNGDMQQMAYTDYRTLFNPILISQIGSAA